MNFSRLLAVVVALMLAAPSFAADFVGVSNQAAGKVNAVRASHGLPALQPAGKLGQAALIHARDMHKNNFMSHTGSDGSNPYDRIKRTGYNACYVAENLAKGQPSINAVVNAWMTSPAHRANLLSTDARHFGMFKGPGNLWVLVFAKRC